MVFLRVFLQCKWQSPKIDYSNKKLGCKNGPNVFSVQISFSIYYTAFSYGEAVADAFILLQVRPRLPARVQRVLMPVAKHTQARPGSDVVLRIKRNVK